MVPFFIMLHPPLFLERGNWLAQEIRADSKPWTTVIPPSGNGGDQSVWDFSAAISFK
jgi:hypothetical protein